MSLWTSRSDREARFTEYVAARHAYLWRIAYALTGDRHRADDLLQTALTKLYLAWPRLADVEHPDAYVRRILVRANIDESRRPWRRELLVDEHPDRADRAEPAGAQLQGLDDGLARALDELSPMQRRCVLLRHWLDLPVTATAHELGISEGAVKTHTARGLAKLQRTLQPAAIAAQQE